MQAHIGIIGVGRMGFRMGENLLTAGYEVVVFDLSEDRIERLVERGATPAASVSRVAAEADIVLTSLPDSNAVEKVYLGEHGLVHSAQPGTLFVETSTVMPATVEEIDRALENRDVELVDAPVIGTPTEAAAATLTVVVGSSESAFERVNDILDVLGDCVEHVGLPGQAKRVKLANNVMTYGNFAIAAEMFAVVTRLGIDPEVFFEITQSGVAGSNIVEGKAPKAFTGAFDPGFTFTGVLKDLRYCLDVKTEADVATPIAAAVTEQYAQGARIAGSELDYSALIDALTHLDM